MSTSITSISPYEEEFDLNLLEKEKTKLPFNYVVEIQKLVAQILTELGRISASDHQAIEKMKTNYTEEIKKYAHYQMDYGRTSRNMSIASFAIFATQFFLLNADDRAMVQLISNQLPTLGSMYTSGYQSEMHKSNAASQLELEKYRTTTANKQSDGNTKQDYLSLLQTVGELQKSASRPG